MRAALISLVLVITSSLPLFAQQGPQRGTVKSFDGASGRIVLTGADGKEIEAAVVPQTMTRGADGQPIEGFRERGVPAGTEVMFRVDERQGRRVLVGLRLAQAADVQKAAKLQGAGKRPAGPPPPPPRESIGVKPLPELGGETYKGQTGGLYGNGSNERPPSLTTAAQAAAARIQPLDAEGKPSPTGKIGLISFGMSNTTQEFSTFKRLADADPAKSPQVVIVDLAQGGKAAEQWNDPGAVGQQTWNTAHARLKAADVTPQQVQVVWLKQALIMPARFGEFPAHAKTLEEELVKNLQLLKQHFPNLQLAYLSSRIYAGYAATPLNPEPFAYESAFAVRGVIEAQQAGDPRLNHDPSRGAVKSPVVLWGPYLWGDGTTPRQDGVVWRRDDLAGDGTHPSPSGRSKVAELLLAHFKTDPFARPWFVK